MFCRRWSGLPSDPEFPANLTDLGFVSSIRKAGAAANTILPSYFVNKEDEIRSIEDEDYYFKYFLTKNERHNVRQRFSFHSMPTLIRNPYLLGTNSEKQLPVAASLSRASRTRVSRPYSSL
jgi:hypothetical protein